MAGVWRRLEHRHRTVPPTSHFLAHMFCVLSAAMLFAVRWKRPCLGLIAMLAVSTAGCDGFKKHVARQIVAAARATRVDCGFRVTDGRVLFFDSNPGEGTIKRLVAEADVKTFRPRGRRWSAARPSVLGARFMTRSLLSPTRS